MSKKPVRIRLDQLLVKKGMVSSVQEAEGCIRSGIVFVNTQCVDKPGSLVPKEADIKLKKKKNHPWVSRGGVKLAHAIEHFSIDVNNKTAIDVGCSTGGFTDVLLHHGAAKVYAVDVGYGELAWSLRQNPSVIVLERTNARHLTQEHIPEMVDMVVCDASFISLKTVLPAALKRLKQGGELVALIKPQFEVAAHEVGAKGVVKDSALHRRVCNEMIEWFGEQPGWNVVGVEQSPIKGPEGNTEFLLYAKYQ